MAAKTQSRRLPASASGYELREQIGQGTCAAVYRAWCEQIESEVAIKVVDLEWIQASLEKIGRETQAMSLSSHPNVVPFSTAFVQEADLWIVMPLLSGGSVHSLIISAFRDGLPENYSVYILHCILKALEYFHGNGQIHRDVKAANLMLDAQGNAMLSDYGMMGWMVEGGWDRKQRQTFVGTPCWMAPEVMEQTGGHDYKADVWSLGITAIELAQGAAPYLSYPPMKVLFLTMQNPPPTISGEATKRYSQQYHDFVATCLQKDPAVRPTVKQLLQHPLFEKGVKKPDTLADTIAKLPPIGSRGGSQRQLIRQLQKNSAPQGSGIHDLSNKGLGWDFGDDTSQTRSSETEKKTTTGSPSPPDPSPSSSVASEPIFGTDTRESFGTLETSSIRKNPQMASDSALSTTASNTRANHDQYSFSSSTVQSNLPTSNDVIDQMRRTAQAVAPTTGSVPGKTVGLLKKGRFTVSDVTTTEGLDEKIGSFLDDDSSPSKLPPSQPKHSEGFSVLSIPSSKLPASISDAQPGEPKNHLSATGQKQSNQPRIVNVSPSPTSRTSRPPQQPKEHSIIRGIAPVVINMEGQGSRVNQGHAPNDLSRNVSSVQTPSVSSRSSQPPKHSPPSAAQQSSKSTTKQTSSQSNPANTSTGTLLGNHPVSSSIPYSRPSNTLQNSSQIQVRQTPNGKTPRGSEASHGAIPPLNPHTQSKPIANTEKYPKTSDGSGAEPLRTAAPGVTKRKSRFEVKDVETPTSKPTTSTPSTTIVPLSTSNTSSAAVSNASLNGPSSTEQKSKSRFEVKDVDEKSLISTIPSSSPPIVNISSITPSVSIATSRQTTPQVSPSSEPFPGIGAGIGKQSLSLLAELTHVIQNLVNENESLRREVQSLRTLRQPGSSPSGSASVGPRSISANEMTTRTSSPMTAGTNNTLQHVQSANAILSHSATQSGIKHSQSMNTTGNASSSSMGIPNHSQPMNMHPHPSQSQPILTSHPDLQARGPPKVHVVSSEPALSSGQIHSQHQSSTADQEEQFDYRFTPSLPLHDVVPDTVQSSYAQTHSESMAHRQTVPTKISPSKTTQGLNHHTVQNRSGTSKTDSSMKSATTQYSSGLPPQHVPNAVAYATLGSHQTGTHPSSSVRTQGQSQVPTQGQGRVTQPSHHVTQEISSSRPAVSVGVTNINSNSGLSTQRGIARSE